MICSKCHHEVRPGAKFCDNCATPIAPLPVEAELTCLVCGGRIEPGAAFCPKCGMPSVASQTDMTVILPKKPAPKNDDQSDAAPDTAFPSLMPTDDVTRGMPAPLPDVALTDDRTRIIGKAAQAPVAKPRTEAYDPRPAVPMAGSSSAEETIMVLDPPPAKSAKSGEPPKPGSAKTTKGAVTPSRKSSKLTAELARQKQRGAKKPAGGGSNTLLIGGIAAIVIVVLAAVAAAWWFKPHRGRKPADVTVTASAPVAAPSQPVATPGQSVPAAVQSPVAPQPVQSQVAPVEAAASQPSVPPTSDLKTEKRPALIVAPSISESAEPARAPEKTEKTPEKASETVGKPASPEPAKSVSSARSSRKQTKAVPKSNKEDDYLRQIHRQLDRQG